MSHPKQEPQAAATMPAPESQAPVLQIPVREDDATILELLRELQRLLERHPRVTGAIISAFVAEGRAYSRTSEGSRLREALLRSERFRRARLIWNAFGLERHAARATSFKPSHLLGIVIAATASPHLEELVSRLALRERDEHA